MTPGDIVLTRDFGAAAPASGQPMTSGSGRRGLPALSTNLTEREYTTSLQKLHADIVFLMAKADSDADDGQAIIMLVPLPAHTPLTLRACRAALTTGRRWCCVMFESTAVSSVILRAAQRGEPRAQPTALLEPSCILHGEIRRQEDAVLVHVF